MGPIGEGDSIDGWDWITAFIFSRMIFWGALNDGGYLGWG